MTKTELIEKLSEKFAERLTKENVHLVINSFVEEIKTSLESGESVLIAGFGTFFPVTRVARMVTTPFSKKGKYEVPSRRLVRFRNGKELQKRLN